MARFIYQAFLTPDAEGGTGYDVSFPDLPGCFTSGESFADAVQMAADAAMTWTASKMKNGEVIPRAERHDAPDGTEDVWVSFETSADYVVDGPVVSAAEASRMLEVSAGRVTRMLESGILDGYRNGRHTYVTVASIEDRKERGSRPGRPRKGASVA